MTPFRPAYWQISHVWLFYLLAGAAVLVFLFGLARHVNMWRKGLKQPWTAFSLSGFVRLVLDGLLGRRIWKGDISAGAMHFLILWGFAGLFMGTVLISVDYWVFPFLKGRFYLWYSLILDILGVMLGAGIVWALIRRYLQRVPRLDRQFKDLAVILWLLAVVVTGYLVEGSRIVAQGDPWASWSPVGNWLTPLFGNPETALGAYIFSWWFHAVISLGFIAYIPYGKLFHIITALPNVYLEKEKKGAIKPARWGVIDITDLDKLGAGTVEDFTWKHLMDFSACTECGRCSEICPANAVGRPLSPKMVTIKLRDLALSRYPLLPAKKAGEQEEESPEIIGDLIQPDEVWSCTTCGACEEECPIMIEYIDKMIDMRRHMIEEAKNPKNFNKILTYFEKTGNPFGKPAAKRAEWTRDIPDVPVRVLKEGDEVDVLFFVDSYGSFDPRVQAIAGAIARGMHLAKIDFGILGPEEWDTGHQVRRLGEEGLFQVLVEQNMAALESIRFKRIVTVDPHAYNTLKKDYPKALEVYHYTHFFWELVTQGLMKPGLSLNPQDRYTYHDPCYLGRHNEVYKEPRELLRSMPGLNFVEMERNRNRSFCCGGGDVILWHEIEQEETRMADKRIKMADEAGANVIVTACPFCLIHFEDAVKNVGLEGKTRVVDLMELLMQSWIGEPPAQEE